MIIAVTFTRNVIVPSLSNKRLSPIYGGLRKLKRAMNCYRERCNLILDALVENSCIMLLYDPLQVQVVHKLFNLKLLREQLN